MNNENIVYIEDQTTENCILWNDGAGTFGVIDENTRRTDYEQGSEILSQDKKPTGEFEQIPVEVDVYQELLDKEESGEIEITRPSETERRAKIKLDAQIKINSDSRAYLNQTSWYVERMLETGKAMPEGMKEARQAARDAVVE